MSESTTGPALMLSSVDEQASMIEAIENSIGLYAEHHDDFSQAVQKICAELAEHSSSNLVCRVLFRCAVLEGSASRARFVSLLLGSAGHTSTARLLADHAASTGAKPWEKRRMTEFMESSQSNERPESARRRYHLTVAGDGLVRVSGADAQTDSSTVQFRPGSDWLSTLAALLDREPVGIHHSVLMLDVAAGEHARQALSAVLPALQILPVVPVLIADSPASVPDLLGVLTQSAADRLCPIVVTPTRTGCYGLITAGGGELLDAGPTHDLVLATVDDLTAVASTVGLIDLYDSPVLRSHQASLVDSFRVESAALLPLWNSTRAFTRVMKFRGTPRATSQLRTKLTGHLIVSGFFEEALALLNAAPRSEHDRIHTARTLRACYGTARFEEAMPSAELFARAPADDALLRESAAAAGLLSDLETACQTPVETLETTAGKVLSILHASVPDQSGGYAVRAHSVLQTIRANGYDVVAVTRPGFPEATNALAPGDTTQFEQDGIRYMRLGTQLARKTGEYSYMHESVEHYCEVIRRERPAVVHLRSTYVSALPGLIAAKRFGLPVLYEVSGMWELVYEASNTARMESRRARTTRFEDAVLSHSDGVVTLTEAMRNIIESRVSTRRAVEIMPNAVDSDVFSPREKDSSVISRFGWDPLVPTIGYIGTFVHYEGLDVLIRAFARLRDKGVQFQALLVGDGAEALRLRTLAAELGLDESTVIHFTGRVPHAEVADLYSIIDICAYPRRLTPATRAVSPIKPFEAMASKKAVIVSDVPALAEIAGHGQRALVVPSDDAEALADALELVISDPQHTQGMVSAAADWTRRERSWNTVGRVMANVLTSLQDNGSHRECGSEQEYRVGDAPDSDSSVGDAPVSEIAMENATT